MQNRKVNWDDVHVSNYESAAFWDVKWISKARDLYECAKKLEPEVVRIWENRRAVSSNESVRLQADHYQGVYFMLLSYAVENLLKASLVAKNGSQYKEKKKFPEDLKCHDLVKLANRIDLKLEAGEEDLFRRLTRSAIWHGRYPAPLKYSDMSGVDAFLDGSKHSVSWYGESDIERLNALISGLPARLALDVQYWERC